jgi:hypothetical protein
LAPDVLKEKFVEIAYCRELVDNHLFYVVERSFAEQSPELVSVVRGSASRRLAAG